MEKKEKEGHSWWREQLEQKNRRIKVHMYLRLTSEYPLLWVLLWAVGGQ